MANELELRTCGRAGCRWPAAASLSFRYDTRQVWLLDLAAEPHPALYDLCPHHAETLTVPRGWDRVDQREPREAMREPSGRDLDVRARTRSAAEPVRVGGNRYAELAAELPRLARQYGTAAPQTVDRPPVVPSRDLAPLPAGEPAARPARGGADGEWAEGRAGADPPGSTQSAGQLAIPVDDLDDVRPGEAVVVSIETAGARRRGEPGH